LQWSNVADSIGAISIVLLIGALIAPETKGTCPNRVLPAGFWAWVKAE
jgi:hypothetical protein